MYLSQYWTGRNNPFYSKIRFLEFMSQTLTTVKDEKTEDNTGKNSVDKLLLKLISD